MEQTEKLSWIEQFKIACLKPTQYKRLLTIGKGRVIWFFVLVSFLITFLGYGMDTIGFTVSVGGPENFIMNRLPAFELRDGTLKFEEPMEFNVSGLHVSADTTKSKVDLDDLSDDYTVELLFTKDEVVMKNSSLQQMISKISFADHKDIVFNNESMARMIPIFYILAFFMFIGVWIANVITYLVFSAFIASLVYMNLKARTEQIPFGKIFQLSIYARVVFQLIETIGTTAGISFFSGMIWLMISYLGSYQLLLMGLSKPKKKEEN